MTLALFNKSRKEHAHTVNHAPEINVDDPFPVINVHVGHRAASADTSVIADDVNCTKCIDCSSTKRINLFALGDVADDSDSLNRIRERCRSTFKCWNFDVGHNDLHALGTELLGQGEANATRCAGNDNNFPRQLLHDDPLRWWKTKPARLPPQSVTAEPDGISTGSGPT